MKTYEKQLEKLIALSDGGKDLVRQGLTGMDEKSLRFLAAKGFISLVPTGNNAFHIRIEPAGLVYFSNQRENRMKFWIQSVLVPIAVSVLTSLIVTGIGYLWTMSGIKTNRTSQIPSSEPKIEETTVVAIGCSIRNSVRSQ